MIEETQFSADDGRRMKAWIARPKGDGPHRAMLVVHEIFGLVENLRAILERFAEEGYVAFAPDLYDRAAPRPICVAAALRTMERGKGKSLDDLRAASRALRGLPDVKSGPIGVSGFCMGGGFALLMALEAETGAVAPFYGASRAYLNKIESSCPVVASYGEKDRVFLPRAKKLQKRLNEAGTDHDLKIYEGVGHSFMTKPRGTLVEKFGAMGPMRVGYDPVAADDAWSRILPFFDSRLP